MKNRWWNKIPSTLRKILDPAHAAGVKLAKTIDWTPAKAGRPSVLCLDRSQFNKDIEELRLNTSLNWVVASSVKLRSAQERWVPKEFRKQGHFSTWLNDERATHIREMLIRFANAFLVEAQRVMPVDAVMSANIDYWQDEAIKLGCQKLGIPFLVLCRENYTIPWTIPWHHQHLAQTRFRFKGTALAVFSQSTKDALLPCFGDPEDIWVTGAPRYDAWLRPLLDESEKNDFCLISFNDHGYRATNTFLEVMGIFDRVARDTAGQGTNWLVKCKKRKDKAEILQRFQSIDHSPIDFQYDVSLRDLYPRSRVVIGYNSLALIEAILSSAPVLVPCWGETRPSRENLLLDYNDPLTRRVVIFPETPEEFEGLLRRAAQGEKLMTGDPAERLALFRQHIHFPGNGAEKATASAAVESFVLHYIK